MPPRHTDKEIRSEEEGCELHAGTVSTVQGSIVETSDNVTLSSVAFPAYLVSNRGDLPKAIAALAFSVVFSW